MPAGGLVRGLALLAAACASAACVAGAVPAPGPTGPAALTRSVGAPFAVVTRGRLAARAQAPLEIRADGERVRFTAADLGLRTDVPGWLPGPVAAGPLADLLVPSREELRAQLADRIDEDALVRALAAVAARVDRPPVDATLRAGEDPTPDAPGRALDRVAARDALARHLVDLRTDPLDLPVVSVAPARTRAALAPAADAARRVLGGRFRLVDGVHEWDVGGGALRSALAVEPDGTLAVHPEPLAGLVEALAADVDTRPQDARLDRVDGRIVVRPERPGRRLDRAATLRALADAVASGNTSVPLRIVAEAPAVVAADLRSTAVRLQRALEEGVRVEVNGRTYAAPPSETWELFTPVRSSDGWRLWVDAAAVRALEDELAAALARGLVLEAGGAPTRAPPDAFAAMLRVGRRGGAWRLSLDREAVAGLVDAAGEALAAREAEPRFARVEGRLRLLSPDRPVGAVDRDAAVRAVLDRWRAGSVPLPTVEPPPAERLAPRRVDQHDRGQYLSPAQASTWELSSCSAAALTSALNARGVPARIHDVIAGLGPDLSPTSGLLSAAALPRVAASLGVPAVLRRGVTLDEVGAAVSAGDIALVDVTDGVFPEGHWLVVTAVTPKEVRVVDSAAARLTAVVRPHFAASWSHRVVLVGEPPWRSRVGG